MENCTYTDAFAIMGSLTDIKIDFALTQPSQGPDGTIAPAPQFEHRIILSLPLAKELAKKLNASVEDYEKQFGSVADMSAIASSSNQQE